MGNDTQLNASLLLLFIRNMVKPIALAWDSVRQAGEDVLEKNSAEALTWGQFKTKLAAALDVDVLVLKVHREQLKELVAKYTAQTDSDEGNQDDEEEDSDGMTAMRAMARAMNLG